MIEKKSLKQYSDLLINNRIELLNSNQSGSYVLPAVKVIENAFTDCDNFIQESLDFDTWYDGEAGYSLNKDVRNVKILSIIPEILSPISWYMVSRCIMMNAKEYAEEVGGKLGTMETPQMLHYISNIDDKYFYKPHFDSGSFNPRDFSAILYLNTVKEGGETSFIYFDTYIQPIAGRLIFFPANYAYLHEALPPVSEDKFAVVTWFRFADDNYRPNLENENIEQQF